MSVSTPPRRRPPAALLVLLAFLLLAVLLFFLGNESTPPWLKMLFDGGAVAAMLVAIVAAVLWLIGLFRAGSYTKVPPQSICLTRGQFDEIEVHYLDSKGHWQYNTFPDSSHHLARLRADQPIAWARYERRYPSLHLDDARMLARFDTAAVRTLAEIERRHGELIARLNRDIVHETLDDCAHALRRLRDARESAQRHGPGESTPPDLAASHADTRALDRARRLPALLGDLEARMKRSIAGDSIDTSGLVLFSSESHSDPLNP